jgi:hypothetical protein
MSRVLISGFAVTATISSLVASGFGRLVPVIGAVSVAMALAATVFGLVLSVVSGVGSTRPVLRGGGMPLIRPGLCLNGSEGN